MGGRVGGDTRRKGSDFECRGLTRPGHRRCEKYETTETQNRESDLMGREKEGTSLKDE